MHASGVVFHLRQQDDHQSHKVTMERTLIQPDIRVEKCLYECGRWSLGLMIDVQPSCLDTKPMHFDDKQGLDASLVCL